ncbi:MAG: hypothetical protein HYZ51_03435 [Candidatus Doudnabacteria bacterium]|nr:hypothetical protein [Candidatus Doudnabacteria bacterium]
MSEFKNGYNSEVAGVASSEIGSEIGTGFLEAFKHEVPVAALGAAVVGVYGMKEMFKGLRRDQRK